jgi:hypothetical protein
MRLILSALLAIHVSLPFATVTAAARLTLDATRHHAVSECLDY